MVKRAIVRTYTAATHVASVETYDSHGTWLNNVPCSHSLHSEFLVAGALCLVEIMDETNPTDAVVIATYPGAAPAVTVSNADTVDGSHAAAFATAAHTHAASDVVSGTLTLDRLPSVPACRLTSSTDQTLSDGTWADLAFNTETYDTDAMHDPSTNNTRITIKTAGKYLITGQVFIKAGDVSVRAAAIRYNNTADLAATTFSATAVYDDTWLNLSLQYGCAVNDYLTLRAAQWSGGNLDTDKSLCWFAAVRIGA
jgi:hypothetical protein